MSLVGEKRKIGPTLIERFLRAAKEYPNNTAVHFNGRTVNYSDLKRLAMNYAQSINDLGVRRLVVCLPRGIETIAVLLACQLRNVPYIPVDTSSGLERVLKIIENTEAHALVSEKTYAQISVRRLDVGIFGLDALQSTSEGIGSFDTALARQPDSTDSYWIYTSGSTGDPKCVMVGEKGCGNLIDSFMDIVAIQPGERWLSTTSIAFDIFFLEYAVPLSVGATLVLLSDQQAASPQEIARELVAQDPHVYQSTPSMFKCLIRYLPDEYQFNRVLVGGEALTRNIAEYLSKRSDWLCNVYGPTETTVWSTAHILSALDDIRIGRPICNTQIFILDKTGTEVVSGEEGRVCIGGAGVARGYFANEKLTRERFRRIQAEGCEKIIYDTGDIGYIDSEGLLNYVRREGDFYKVNGYRVDPAEVKEALEQIDGLEEAGVIVAAAKEGGDDAIVGFYKINDQNRSLTQENILANLDRYLAPYLIPHYIFGLDNFPYTVSGKLDNKQLDAIFRELVGQFTNKSSESVTASDDPILLELAKYINVENIKEDENIFNRGLTSMAAVMLHIDLMKIDPNIELYHIFNEPTLAGIRSCSS